MCVRSPNSAGQRAGGVLKKKKSDARNATKRYRMEEVVNKNWLFANSAPSRPRTFHSKSTSAAFRCP